MIYHMEQRSDEWQAVRCGRITGTSFATMANGKSDTITKLCIETAAERITGQPQPNGYQNAVMQRGSEIEPRARAMYGPARFLHVEQVGFVDPYPDDLPNTERFLGMSPDGLVDDDGGLELKCPLQATHLKYLRSDGAAWRAYKWQVQGGLWITGRAWWDFVSYHPDFPPDQQMLIERVGPDAAMFAQLETGAAACIEQIKEIVESVSG